MERFFLISLPLVSGNVYRRIVPNMPKINCAIYMRKSIEHGLDMEFNSLQNQEEACKASSPKRLTNGNTIKAIWLVE